MQVTYKVSDLKRLVEESSKEFKAVIGKDVEKDNKANSGKAYKDAKKKAQDLDGGLKDEVGKEKKAKFVKSDDNKTTIDYTMDNASEEYKKRVHAQVKGYTSIAEMENGIEKVGEFDNNENIYQGIKDAGKETHKKEADFKSTGLQSSQLPKKEYVKGEMYESKEGVDMRNIINDLKAKSFIPKPTLNENAKLKTIYFKKTAFLTEGHMVSRIPDEFKKNGEQFKMKDKNGTEYIVEWNNGNAHILGYENRQKINETMDKFHHISNFKSIVSEKPTQKQRCDESGSVNRMLEIMRGINKK